MSLDNLPALDRELIDAQFSNRHRSRKSFEEFQAEIHEFREKCEPFADFIDELARNSNDPKMVYCAVYGSLDILGAFQDIKLLKKVYEPVSEKK